MTEIQMQDYEEIRRKDDDHKYDDLKIDEKKVKIDHAVVPYWKKWNKRNCLALTIYMLTTGFVLTVIYFTVIVQLRQKLADIDMKLTAIEKQNKTKLRESEKIESSNLDTHITCYNGGISQKHNNGYICVCTEGFLGKQCGYSDGKDKSFLVIFLERRQSPSPMILVASANTGNLSIRYFNNNANQNITFDKRKTEHTLSNSVLSSDGIHLTGVEVHSDVRVNLYGLVHQISSSEGFLSMPSRFASTKYIVPSSPAYTDIHHLKNVLAFSPIYQNTAVSIHLKLRNGAIEYGSKRYNNNDTIKLVLNKYSTLQLSHTFDLSGTMVTSSKPVIVVSGSQYDYSLSDMVLRGTFIESVLPTDQLDNMFITPYISTHLNNTVRIQAVNNTNLTIKTGNIKTLTTLHARNFYDFHYNTISFISSSDELLVMLYPYRLDGEFGDPSNFMMTIPGVNQYLYEYDFVVPSGSCISITVQSDFIDGFLFDGKSANNRSSVFSISEGSHQFSTFSMCITGGKHHMVHRKKVRFGLWVYGDKIKFNGSYGYGYPAGMAYKTFN